MIESARRAAPVPDQPDRVIAEIPRASRENLRVLLRQRRGHMACELRVAAQSPRGVMVETPQGIRVPLPRLRDLIRALEAAEREVERRGLMPAAERADTRIVA